MQTESRVGTDDAYLDRRVGKRNSQANCCYNRKIIRFLFLFESLFWALNENVKCPHF